MMKSVVHQEIIYGEESQLRVLVLGGRCIECAQIQAIYRVGRQKDV